MYNTRYLLVEIRAKSASVVRMEFTARTNAPWSAALLLQADVVAVLVMNLAVHEITIE